MTLNIKFDYSVQMPDCKIETIIGCFRKLLLLMLADFTMAVLNKFATHYMEQQIKPFKCKGCGNRADFIWKTKWAKDTTIKTIFGDIILGQMQVKCKECGKKRFITRELLGIAARRRASEGTEQILALVGSLTSFRVSEKILGLVGVKVDKMAVWRCVQRVGERISFGLDPDALPIGEADGTGVRIQGIKKRGRELKVFVQRKAKGVRIAGVSIGKYESEWDKLFDPLRDALKTFKNFLLITDGDTSILKPLKGLKILFQRCLWHIPYQMKYYLWKDDVNSKSDRWYHILGEIFDITAIRHGVDDEEEIKSIMAAKSRQLERLLQYCQQHGCTCCKTYLENAQPDMFTAFRKKLQGKSTSHVERVMRTVNLRTTVGKWSPRGALNAVKVRLAHYYNGFDPPEQEPTDNDTVDCKAA